jgi:LysR family transcriptional regulator (chromosome initiation inhibitor)
LRSGRLLDLAPGHALPVELYWHCWNLHSVVLESLTRALTQAAKLALVQSNKPTLASDAN